MQPPPEARPPLLVATQTRLNVAPTTSSKRKREDTELEGKDGIKIVAKPYASSTSPSPAIFKPIVTVARADLPLISLDSRDQFDGPSSGYLFEAVGSILQILAPKQTMVARLCPNGRLYALEKVQDNVYSATLLSIWVTEDHCRMAATGETMTIDITALASHPAGQQEQQRPDGSVSTISSIRIPTPLGPKQPNNRKGALARKSILASKDSQGAKTPSEPASAGHVESPQKTATVSVPFPHLLSPTRERLERSNKDVSIAKEPQEELEHPPVSIGEIQVGHVELPQPTQSPSDEIHFQYLEALYARTSLAFYAKGPLSRARGILKENEARLDAEELHALYASIVLSSKKMDIKYKESLPTFLKHLSMPGDESQHKRKKNSKKMKLGKDCLYTCEHDLLRKWWVERAMPSNSATFDAQVRKYTADLRNREAEMQLLLLLEIMILGTMKEIPGPTTAPVGQEIKIESVEQEELPAKSERKLRKRDFNGEMDALLDRLCIWHTVTLEDFLISPEKASNSSSTQSSKDKLKEFCTDIIVPFYVSKLPEQVKSICKKLGGPNISPQRPKLARSRSISSQKSNAHLVGRTASTTKTSLQRVLSQDQELRHASPPVSVRSSSSHGRSGSAFKREPSEAFSRPSSRAGMQKSDSFSNREIDLVADAKLQETKRRKLEQVAGQKRELASAIEALKKPNRSNVAKAIMDEAEKRAEPKLQIMATPRKGTVHSARANANANAPLPDFHFLPAGSESEPLIPSSSLRPPHSLTTLARPSARKRAVLSAIHDTPSRGQEERTFDPLNLNLSSKIATKLQVSSLSDSHSTAITATPAASRQRRPEVALPVDTPVQLKMTDSGKPVLFTALKRTEVSIEDAFRDAPVIPERAGMAMDRAMGGKGREMFGSAAPNAFAVGRGTIAGPSLYAQLGWDDDDDDDDDDDVDDM